MQITDKILNILRSINGIKTVIHDTPFSTNVRLDRRETIAAILFMVQEFSIDIKSGMRKDSVDLEVFICDRCDLAAKGEVVETVLDGIRPVVNQFIALLANDRTLALDGDTIEVNMAYGKFDTNVVGYSLQLKLTERQGICIDSNASGVKTVYITKNGEYDVTPYGIANVNVQDGEIQLQEKTATTNGVITPDLGFNGLSKVTVQVPQPQGTLQRTITENGTTNIDIANYQTIEITTNVPTGSTCDLYTGLTVEANGVYDPVAYNKNGFSTFVVNIPQPQGTLRRTITQNGVETVDVGLWENIEITTDVPTPTCNLYTGLTVEANGVYDPLQYGNYDGFGSISVDVQPQNTWKGTWADYILINPKDSDTLYLITD